MMRYFQFRYYKRLTTKLLLLVTMFFGAFIFSAYVGNSQSLQRGYSVELIASKSNKPLKRIVSYNKVLRSIDFRKTPIYFQNSLSFLALEHNRIAKVAVNNATAKRYLIKSSSFCYLQQKTISKASDDEVFIKLG